MTLDEKIRNNIKLTEKETKILIEKKQKEFVEWKKEHPDLVIEPVKTQEQKWLDGDEKLPNHLKIVDGKIEYKTRQELYKDGVISSEEYAQEKRQERDWKLEQTDKYMLSDFPISAKDKEIIIKYRKELRDIPTKKDFPDVEIPTLPVL